jgi:hypothetical protein
LGIGVPVLLCGLLVSLIDLPEAWTERPNSMAAELLSAAFHSKELLWQMENSIGLRSD